MKVHVDEDICIGSGNCAAICPEVFELRDGKSQVKASPVPQGLEESVEEAVNSCPVQAIWTS